MFPRAEFKSWPWSQKVLNLGFPSWAASCCDPVGDFFPSLSLSLLVCKMGILESLLHMFVHGFVREFRVTDCRAQQCGTWLGHPLLQDVSHGQFLVALIMRPWGAQEVFLLGKPPPREVRAGGGLP